MLQSTAAAEGNGNGSDGKKDFGNGRGPELQVSPVKAPSMSLLQLDPVQVSVKGLNVSVKHKSKKKRVQILKSIDAVFKPGSVTAMMGPSGAGKTTLMNVLLGRDDGLTVDCQSMRINGENFTKKRMQSISTLVPQDDILLPMLTCRESLFYAAKLTQTGLTTSAQAKIDLAALVADVLLTLGLTSCADTVCGDADLKGLSGGQRKRVSIGVELIRNPSCLFLDEPTSGLDSKVALDVVLVLRKLASEGRTVVCTIHQPSVEIFVQFDRLILLKRGEMAYQGPVSEVKPFFRSIGYPIPENKNPADFILNAVSDDSFTSLFSDNLGKNEYYNSFNKFFKDAEIAPPRFLSSDNMVAGRQKVSSFVKTIILIQRACYVTVKDKKQFRMRFMQQLIVSLIIGLTYLRLDKIQTAIFDRQSAIILSLMFNMMSSIMGTVNAVPTEKTVLFREYRNNLYSVNAYFVSRTFVYLLFQVLYNTVYIVLIYNLVGFSSGADHFFIYYAAMLMAGSIAVMLGFLFGSIFPTVAQATAIAPLIIMPFFLFSGLLVAYDNIPVYFIWLYYISFMQYVFQIMVVNEFTGFDFEPCTELQLTTAGKCPFGSCAPPGMPPRPCPGSLVLLTNDYDIDFRAKNFGILFSYLCVVIFLAYLGVKSFVKSK